MIGYIGKRFWQRKLPVLYEDSRAMLIVKTILMREEGHGSGATGRGYRCYTGEKIDVYFNTAICQHSGNCVRGNGKLFNLKRKPWIMPDEVDVATVVKVIDTCPSGALKYRHK